MKLVLRSSILPWLATCLACVALLSGCGPRRPKRVSVSGQVLVDGKPLTFGFVRMIPADKRPAVGELDAEGRFRMTTYEGEDGCVLGEHAVEVHSYNTDDPYSLRSMVPPKYQDHEKWGKTVNIEGPTDALVFELSWEGEDPEQYKVDISSDGDPSKW